MRIFIILVVILWPIVGTFMLHTQMKTVISGTKTHCQFHTQKEAFNDIAIANFFQEGQDNLSKTVFDKILYNSFCRTY